MARFKRWLSRGEIRFGVVLAATLAVVILVSAGSLLLLNSRTVSQMRSTQVAQEFEIVAAAARSQIFAQIVSADAVLDTLAMSLPETAADEATGIALARVLAEMLEASPAVDAVYLAKADGSFTLARKVTADGPDRPRPAGMEKASFEIRRGGLRGEARVEAVTYLDGRYGIVGRVDPVATEYDPRNRRWYRLAAATDVAVITSLYRFQDRDGEGITLSRRSGADAATVFGIDLTLAELSLTLKRTLSLPEQQVVVFERDGSVIGSSADLRNTVSLDKAASDEDAPLPPGLAQARAVYAAYRDRSAKPAITEPAFTKHAFTMEVAGEEIMADLTPFRFDNQEFVVASYVPLKVVREPIVRWAQWSLGLQVLIVLLAIVLALRAARLLSDPIMTLTKDVEAIIAFRFSDAPRATSRIREIRRLAGSVDMLEMTLKAFSTYLPAHFVRDIVETRVLPRLGGRKQNVVVMFTDITGFTTLAESLPPDALMHQMSRYLKELSDEILAAGGTVDKFIGDSVMAFWAEGTDDSSIALQACNAALNAARRIERLNACFIEEGLPPMPTRFGLHLGEAMVGSVGTLDRMNYTVLGHTVNVASRIEGLNKTYGTSILVTDVLVEACGDRLDSRLVDRVMVRGASEAITVFELRGML